MGVKFYLYFTGAVLVTTVFLYYTDFSYIKSENVEGTRQILQVEKELSAKVQDYIYSPPDIDLEPEKNNIENLPEYFLDDKAAKPKNFNKTCATFPDLFKIKFTGDHWQAQKTSKGTFQLYNAYLDDRKFNVRPKIRIIGLYDIFKPDSRFYCQIYYKIGQPPVFVETLKFDRIWVEGWGGDRDGFFQPYIISCPVPADEKLKQQVPISVSLVENKCDNATNNLKINNNHPTKTKKNFVVCVKGLNFPFSDLSHRLVEWLELLFILGADKVNFYNFHVHPNIEKVLNYYSDKGQVEVSALTLAGEVSNNPQLQNLFLHKKVLERRLQEVIPYNDCFYKHFNEFKYVILLDTDEVIVPVTGTWIQLLQNLETTNENVASFVARNVYFLDNPKHAHDWFEGIPKFMHMLQHVYRSENYTKPGQFVKGFHNTSKVVALHNHFPLLCDGYCKTPEISLNLAQMQHYRGDCVKGLKNCEDMKENSVVDFRVWNFKEDLIGRVVKALDDLGLLKTIG